MTAPLTEERIRQIAQEEMAAATAQAVAANADRLGLTWQLRPGTTQAPGDSTVPVICDGDTVAVTAINLLGPITTGARVMVLTIPPGGVFLFGYLASSPLASGARIGTTIRDTSSAGFTAETLIDSVTVPQVIGRIYRITWDGAWASTVSGDTVFGRIREDSLVGVQLQLLRVHTVITGGAGTRWPGRMEVEYTATFTGDKTFVSTGARVSGTGSINAHASTNFPIYLYVDYIRG